MHLFPQGTIRQQLRTIILVTAGLALLSASAAVVGFLTFSYRRTLVRELGQMTALVEASGTAALEFEDRDQAAQALLPLQRREDILAAALYTRGGTLLAHFRNAGGARARLPEPGPEQLTFSGGGVRMVKAIRLHGRTIGTLCLAADQGILRRELGLAIVTVAAIACLSMVLAFGFAQGLLARLATPLAELAATARTVARRHDYRIRVRVRPAGQDELGGLIADFNAMLAQVEQRDQELQAHRERLEELVRARTAQLERDMEERKALEKQFLRAQRMESLGTLAGGVAHDLNNVLAPILLSIQALQEGTADPSRRHILDLIEAAAVRGRDVVRQILAFARGIEGQRAPLDFPALVRETEAIVRRTFPKNIAVCLDLAPDLAPVVGDATQVHQLLMNLCVNARDAMPAGGTLTLAARNVAADPARLRAGARPGPGVVLSVADTGCGMAPQVLERIFEPFFTTKGVGQGTGLGLSTVHAIARSHGGCVRCASEAGRGTAFEVFLPAAEPGTGPGPAPAAASPALAEGAGRVVLVVDDEASVREMTRHTLESFGYRVLTARDGREAVACCAAHPGGIAAVVMDLMMPVMDGQEAIAILRQRDPDLPIVATSGLPDPDPGGRPGVRGADLFLAKPFDADTLMRTLARVLDRTPALTGA